MRRLARPNVEFMGWGSDREIEDAYASCRALVFPAEEDFGIVPVEAMASGKPVIAFGKGGALETVSPLDSQSRASTAESRQPPATGIFFHEQTAESLERAIKMFEDVRDGFDPYAIRRHAAERFSRQRFKGEIEEFLEARYSEFRASGSPLNPR